MHLGRPTSLLETIAAIGRQVSVGAVQTVCGVPTPTWYRQGQFLQDLGVIDGAQTDGRSVIAGQLIPACCENQMSHPILQHGRGLRRPRARLFQTP